MGHFHFGSMNDYRFALSQLDPNYWRIIGSFFLGCRINRVIWDSRLFRHFYSLKTQVEFYFFQSKGTPIVIDLPNSNKGWKRHLVCIRSLNGFEVSLEWKVANVDRNRVLGVSTNEREDLDKIVGQKFTSKLMEDIDQLRCYWPIVILPNINPQSTF